MSISSDITSRIHKIIQLEIDKGLPRNIYISSDIFEGFTNHQIDSAIHQFLKMNHSYDLFYDVSTYDPFLRIK